MRVVKGRGPVSPTKLTSRRCKGTVSRTLQTSEGTARETFKAKVWVQRRNGQITSAWPGCISGAGLKLGWRAPKALAGVVPFAPSFEGPSYIRACLTCVGRPGTRLCSRGSPVQTRSLANPKCSTFMTTLYCLSCPGVARESCTDRSVPSRDTRSPIRVMQAAYELHYVVLGKGMQADKKGR